MRVLCKRAKYPHEKSMRLSASVYGILKSNSRKSIICKDLFLCLIPKIKGLEVRFQINKKKMQKINENSLSLNGILPKLYYIFSQPK